MIVETFTLPRLFQVSEDISCFLPIRKDVNTKDRKAALDLKASLDGVKCDAVR